MMGNDIGSIVSTKNIFPLFCFFFPNKHTKEIVKLSKKTSGGVSWCFICLVETICCVANRMEMRFNFAREVGSTALKVEIKRNYQSHTYFLGKKNPTTIILQKQKSKAKL